MEVLEIHPTADLQLGLFWCFPAWYFCLMVFDPGEMFTILTASFLPGCPLLGEGPGVRVFGSASASLHGAG